MSEMRQRGRMIPYTVAASVTAVSSFGLVVAAAPAHASGSKTPPNLKPSYTIDGHTVTRAQIEKFLAGAPHESGVGEQADPGFGIGKATVTAKSGTFPSDMAPSMDGIVVNFTDTDDSEGDASCTTSAEPASNPPKGDCNTFVDEEPLIGGDHYTISVDPSTLPAHFIAPPSQSVTSPSCTDIGPDCGANADFITPGEWRPVGLTVVNAKTGKPVSGATFHLCSPTTGAPPAGGESCPTGTTDLGSATSNSDGHLVFPGVHLPSDNYSFFSSSVPKAYLPDPNRLEVPVPTYSQAGTEVDGTAKLQPRPPHARDDSASTKQGFEVTVAVLHNDTSPAGKLKIQHASKSSHGTVTVLSGGHIRYAPDAGFVGTDTFTYRVADPAGGTDTATVTIHVSAVQGLNASTLPNTGSPLEREGAVGLGAIGLGLGLTMLTRRQRRGKHAS